MANTALPFALGAGAAALLAAGVYALRGAAAAEPDETTQWTEQQQRKFADEWHGQNARVPDSTSTETARDQRDRAYGKGTTFGFSAGPTHSVARKDAQHTTTDSTEATYNALFKRLRNLKESDALSIPVIENPGPPLTPRERAEAALSKNRDLDQRAAEDIATLRAVAKDIKKTPFSEDECQYMYHLYIEIGKRYRVEAPYDDIFYSDEVPSYVPVHRDTLKQINQIFESIEKKCGWR